MTRSRPKPKPRIIPSRELFPRKVKKIRSFYREFEKTPEAFLYYLKNIYGKPQLDIFDKNVKISKYSYKSIEYTFENTKLFFKVDFIKQNFMYIENSMLFFSTEYEGDDKDFYNTNSLLNQYSGEFQSKYGYGKNNILTLKVGLGHLHPDGSTYSKLSFFNLDLLSYLKRSDQEDKYLYTDIVFEFGNQLTFSGHTCGSIYDPRTRIFLILDTTSNGFIRIEPVLNRINKWLSEELNITLLYYPIRDNLDIQKIDTTHGNCTQWRYVIPYFFLKENMQEFFKLYSEGQKADANRLMFFFYSKLDNFTVEDFNKIAANFLCYYKFRMDY